MFSNEVSTCTRCTEVFKVLRSRLSRAIRKVKASEISHCKPHTHKTCAKCFHSRPEMHFPHGSHNCFFCCWGFGTRTDISDIVSLVLAAYRVSVFVQENSSKTVIKPNYDRIHRLFGSSRRGSVALNIMSSTSRLSNLSFGPGENDRAVICKMPFCSSSSCSKENCKTSYHRYMVIRSAEHDMLLEAFARETVKIENISGVIQFYNKKISAMGDCWTRETVFPKVGEDPVSLQERALQEDLLSKPPSFLQNMSSLATPAPPNLVTEDLSNGLF